MRRFGTASRLGIAGAVSAALAVAACVHTAPGPDPAADGRMLAAPEDWPSFGRTPGEQHYSPLEQIDRKSVERLSLAWHFDLPSEHTVSAPVAAEGKLFITTGHSTIRAFDAVSGELLWTYDSGTRQRAGHILRFFYGNRGLAYWEGHVFIATYDGRVIALDAKTGEPVWQQTTTEPGDGRFVAGPPRVFDGRLVIGHGGADFGPVRGYVDCFDARSGERLWRFYTVPGNPADGFENEAMEMAAETWSGEWWRFGGGGTAWNAFSYDPELNQLYIGVGNGYPYNHTLRSEGEGDNLFLASIVAVDADTGDYVWHYQTTPAEQTDYTATMDMTLATLRIDGRQRRVLMQAPKNGFFYVLDRTSGELISAEPFAEVTWATHVDLATGRPVEVPGYRYHGKELFRLKPSFAGAHSWLPQSFSPKTGLVYIPVIENAIDVGDKGIADLEDSWGGLGMVSHFVHDIPEAHTGYLKAWDPVAQEARWIVKQPSDWPGGTLATAGGLVFQGRIDGKFVAYDAETGSEVWTYEVGVPVIAPPISFGVNGTQYVSVLTGFGTAGAGSFVGGTEAFDVRYRLPRRLLTFALDGRDELPRDAPLAAVVSPDPTFVSDPELEREGALHYHLGGCASCHGMGGASGGAAPDLRYSPFPTDRAAFQAAVRAGSLVDAGMPRFEELSAQQTEAIRQYLRALMQQLRTGDPEPPAPLPF